MEREPVYEEQLTAFIDFLGFSGASFPEQAQAILSTLQRISALRSEASVFWEGAEGESAFSLDPAISSFSDHIVISYPISQLGEVGATDESKLALILVNLRYRVGRIAAEAFRLGFLIRGGISLGGLYHSAGIVFGEALIEAYRLESEVARYPRIVFSPSVVRTSGFASLDNRLFRRDQDGEQCFEYIYPMLMEVSEIQPLMEGIVRWYGENIGFIESQIRRWTENRELSKAAKWEWFKTELSHSLTRHGARSAVH